MGFPRGLAVKNPHVKWETQETRVQFLCQKDPLEEGMATRSSALAWRSHGLRSLVGCSPGGRTESEKTEATERAMRRPWANSAVDLTRDTTWIYRPSCQEAMSRTLHFFYVLSKNPQLKSNAKSNSRQTQTGGHSTRYRATLLKTTNVYKNQRKMEKLPQIGGHGGDVTPKCSVVPGLDPEPGKEH